MAQDNLLSQGGAASALFLREDAVRRGIDDLLFAQAALWRTLDLRLAEAGLGRAHYRALYFIARQDDITVTDMLALLGITKQSLGRVVRDLEARDLVTARQGTRDRRQRALRLTDSGRALERELFAAWRDAMSRAYMAAGQEAVGGFWQLCEALVPPRERARIAALNGGR